jgi:hypothetical protein
VSAEAVQQSWFTFDFFYGGYGAWQKCRRKMTPFEAFLKLRTPSCGAYNFGYGLGDQEPFDFRDPFCQVVPRNPIESNVTRNSEGADPLSTFCRIEDRSARFRARVGRKN